MKAIHSKPVVLFIVAVIILLALSGCAHKPAAPGVAIPASSGVSTKETAPALQRAETGKAPVTPETEGAIAPQSAETAGAKTQQSQSEAVLGDALQTIYFNYDSSALSTDARETLYRNFQQLSSNGQLNVQIEGHCDERGSDDYNLALGEKRAAAARNYLISLGVSDERISTISYGKEKPAVEGSDEAAWARNRRAEFVIQK